MRHATPFASSVGVTIAECRAQVHVDVGEATFPTRKIFMAMVTLKANVVVFVLVQSKIVNSVDHFLDGSQSYSSLESGKTNDEVMVCEEESGFSCH